MKIILFILCILFVSNGLQKSIDLAIRNNQILDTFGMDFSQNLMDSINLDQDDNTSQKLIHDLDKMKNDAIEQNIAQQKQKKPQSSQLSIQSDNINQKSSIMQENNIKQQQKSQQQVKYLPKEQQKINNINTQKSETTLQKLQQNIIGNLDSVPIQRIETKEQQKKEKLQRIKQKMELLKALENKQKEMTKKFRFQDVRNSQKIKYLQNQQNKIFDEFRFQDVAQPKLEKLINKQKELSDNFRFQNNRNQQKMEQLQIKQKELSDKFRFQNVGKQQKMDQIQIKQLSDNFRFQEFKNLKDVKQKDFIQKLTEINQDPEKIQDYLMETMDYEREKIKQIEDMLKSTTPQLKKMVQRFKQSNYLTPDKFIQIESQLKDPFSSKTFQQTFEKTIDRIKHDHRPFKELNQLKEYEKLYEKDEKNDSKIFAQEKQVDDKIQKEISREDKINQKNKGLGHLYTSSGKRIDYDNSNPIKKKAAVKEFEDEEALWRKSFIGLLSDEDQAQLM